MTLKDSYRYANFLSMLLDQAVGCLFNNDFITTTTETHKRKKYNSEADDEVVKRKKIKEVNYTPSDMVDFIIDILKEKEKLEEAIRTAKSKADFDIDNAIALNKDRQNVARALKYMSDFKNSVSVSTGKSYKFDANNEQKPYVYDIETETHIDYDRKNARNLAKKLLKASDETSSLIDKIKIETEVDFECRWDVSDSLDDLVEENKH